MGFELKELGEFNIIGIKVRTTNQNGQSKKDIGELWGKFLMENCIEQIPNMKSGNIYCIYSNYETDQSFDTILGCHVSSVEDIPEGFIGHTIPNAKYQIYTSAGPLPDSVVETWEQIWKSTDIKRNYIADFDIYDEKAQNPMNAEVKTYISVQ